jgi:hypothetical protein
MRLRRPKLRRLPKWKMRIRRLPPWALRLLYSLWLLFPVGLAVYSFTQPWAKARVVLFWGISRSPEAMVLVLLSLLLTVGAGILVAGRRRGATLAAIVHLATGALMCLVSWFAYRMVENAGTKALGFIPLASVRPGPGLRTYFLASLLVLAWGLAGLVRVLLRRRRHRHEPAPLAA